MKNLLKMAFSQRMYTLCSQLTRRWPTRPTLQLIVALVSIVCFSSIATADVSVSINGPLGVVSQSVAGDSGSFDLNVPLRKNSINKMTVSASDAFGNKASKEVQITQISFDSLVVAEVKAEPLTVQQIEKLVNDGVIQLDDPENFNVSQFDIVLTIAQEPIRISIPIAVPKAPVEEPTGSEVIKIAQGDGGGGRSQDTPPIEIVVFQVQPSVPGHYAPPIPGIIVIEGRIKTLKEFFSVKFLVMNTSGIFTLQDVNAELEFPDGGLSNTLPADGIGALGDILPGEGTKPGQANKEFIVRGDEIGTKRVKVNFGGKVGGAGIPEGDEVPFNGSAETSIEVKGPPSFLVQVDHPDSVEAFVPYDLTIDITNTGQTPALYASLDLDVGFDATLVKCGVDANLDPFCDDLEGPETRSFGHILPGQTVREVFRVKPFGTGSISSCMGISDQNITLQVTAGSGGCLTGHFPPNRKNSDGIPTVSVLPPGNVLGVSIDSPVALFFSEAMQHGTITTGPGGTVNVYDRAGTRQPGELRKQELNGDTVAIWQFKDGITNRLATNMEYTVEVSQNIKDFDGNSLVSQYTSRFTTTGVGIDDTTPPVLTLSTQFPVTPNNVLPGQVVNVMAYPSDQGSGISRVELRIKDLSVVGSLYKLIDQKKYTIGDKFPYIFKVDSKTLIPGHTYQLLGTAYDGVGNPGESTLALVIATSAPIPTIALPTPDAAGYLRGVGITVTPTEVTGGGYEVRYYIDSAVTPFKSVSVIPYGLIVPTKELSIGTHTLRAVVIDGLNQTGEALFEFEVLENNFAPEISFSSPTEDQDVITGSVLPISATATDATGVVATKWFFDNPNGAAFAQNMTTFSLNTTGIPLGEHKIYLVATNAIGLSNSAAESASFRTINIINPPPEPAPSAPSISNITLPSSGETTVTGTTNANRRVDITNTAFSHTVSVTSNGSGSFSASIAGDSGNQLEVKAFNAAQTLVSPAATTVIPTPAALDFIEISPTSRTFNAFNLVENLTVTAHYVGGATENVTNLATYSSTNNAVASVNSTGQVVSLSNGNVVITASFGGEQATAAITVDVVVLQSISVLPVNLSFAAVAETAMLVVTEHFSNGTSQTATSGLNFGTGNPGIATVSAAGLVTAVAHGSTQITITKAGVTPISVPVLVDTGIDQAPTIQILSPNGGTGFERGETVTLNTQANDSEGGVKRIEFTASGAATASETRQVTPALLETTQSFQFVIPDNAAIGGVITLSVTAIDTGDNSSTTAAIQINVVDTTAPAVSITAPTPGAAFDYGDTVSVTVHATDLVGVTQLRYVASGSLSFSATQNFPGGAPTADHTFTFVVPFGLSDPEANVTAFAKDAAGNETEAISVDITVIGADSTPPATEATAVSNPGSSATATVSYTITDGLADLDHVELYFRRNNIGTFNRYTNAAGGNPQGEFTPQSGANGTISFDSTRMGGDGSYEFYTVGVDAAGNREAAPASADQSRTFATGVAVSVITVPTTITAGDASFDNKNIRVTGTTLTVVGAHAFRNIELLNGAVLTQLETDGTTEHAINISGWTLTIDATSSINVDGRGYLGGSRPGNADCAGRTSGNVAGSTSRSAGSYGGQGGAYDGVPNAVYGNLTAPNDSGSGGSCGAGNIPGGDGGGKVLLQLVNLIADGAISANGLGANGNQGGSGSGGAINIATSTVSGLGAIRANGGVFEVGGGGGRIAITYADRSTKDASLITALAGVGNWAVGGNGTVFLRSLSEANGTLVVDGQGAATGFSNLPIPPGYIFDNITVRNNARVIVSDEIVVNNRFEVLTGSIVTHPVSFEPGLNITAQRVYVDATSFIDLNGKGYRGGFRDGNANCFGETLAAIPGAAFRSGGSYGGAGGVMDGVGSNLPYGDPLAPRLLGSGGSCGVGNLPGGNGGGRLTINATEEVRVDGAVRSNGNLASGNQGGSGSGGSIQITTSLLRGVGVISANGGTFEVGGSGGRVFIEYDFLGATGAEDLNGTRNIQSFGGKGNWAQASAGTVVLKRSDQAIGNLYFDEGLGAGQTSGISTPLVTIGFGESLALTANTLTTDGTTPLLPNGLVGLKINPNLNQEQLFTIVSNTVDTITVDTSAGTLTSVASAGDPYAGVYRFDNVNFRRGGYAVLGDQLFVDDTLLVDESGLLTHFGATTSFTSRLELAVENLEVSSTGRIDVTGRGYLGGFAPGNATCSGLTVGNLAGSQFRSGGSFGGLGGRYDGAPNPIYGNITNPEELGSGGSCGAGNTRGGNGGGRIDIAAGSIVIDGTVSANGTTAFGNQAGSGSGGSINITTSLISGSGLLTANGGVYETGGGGGRIAIRYDTFNLPEANIRAVGGIGNWAQAGNGTVFLKSFAQGLGDLVIDGFGQNSPTDTTPIPPGVTFDNITFRNNARIVADSGISATNTIRLENGSVVTHSPGSEAGLSITAPTLLIDATSAIDVSTRGYRGGFRDGNPSCEGITLGGLPGAASRSGGSYGGRGGVYDGVGTNPPYGDPKDPILLGAGGSCGAGNTLGGNGGGYVEIATTTLDVDGAIRSNGQTGSGNQGGSGSGGSINIQTSTFAGSGIVQANGGIFETGGSGGRIAVRYNSFGPDGDNFDGLRNVTSFGGIGNWAQASSGTVYFKHSSQADGDLIIDNTSAVTATPLPLIGNGTIAGLSADTLVTDGSVALPPAGLVGMKINPNTEQNQTFTVISNTANSITVDVAGGNLTSIAEVGDKYIGVHRYDNVTVRRFATFVLADLLEVTDTLNVTENGSMTHYDVRQGFLPHLQINVGTLNIGATATINVDGRGYLGGFQPGNTSCEGRTIGNTIGSLFRSGGSFGGLGGNFGGAPNPVYSSANNPADFGSGGSCGAGNTLGGDGGGWVEIVADAVTVDGLITANGLNGHGNQAGSGSGGAIRIVTGVLNGSGVVRANGGVSEVGGGGGRIAVSAGSSSMGVGQFTVIGGAGNWAQGGVGSVVLE